MNRQTADAVVIGGGVIGTSIAYHLARAGVGHVVLLERAHLCAGTTGQSGAIIRQHYSNPFTAALARDSLQVFRRWADEIGGDAGFRESGVLLLAGESTEGSVRVNVAMHRSLGIDTRVIAPEEAREIEPGLATDDLTLACWEATAGLADPVATVAAFATAARRLGAEVREGVEVIAIATASGRVSGVETSGGKIDAPLVVNAGNVWGARLLGPLGIDMPITASRHPMAMLRRPVDAAAGHPVVLDLHRQTYLIPRGPHTLSGSLATAPVDLSVDPDGYHQGVTEAEIARFVADGAHRMPALRRAVVHGGWAGIYDESPDAHPVLDEAPNVAGLFLALGFSGHGFKLAPAIADGMARRILRGPAAAPELQPFRFSRFAENDLIGANYAVGVLA